MNKYEVHISAVPLFTKEEAVALTAQMVAEMRRFLEADGGESHR